MALITCGFCQKVFNGYGTEKLCPDCMKQVDSNYIKIKKYMYSAEGPITAASIVEDLEIDSRTVDFLINDGRLELGKNSFGTGRCRICGKTTKGEALCQECKEKFESSGINEFREQLREERERDKEYKKSGKYVNPLVRDKYNR